MIFTRRQHAGSRRSWIAGATRSSTITNARNKTMLRLMLGEVLEQKRFFDQALAGRDDLLGRRADGMGTQGQSPGDALDRRSK